MGLLQKGMRMVIFFMAIPAFCGCTLKLDRPSRDVTLPEAVYRSPPTGDYARSNAVVFGFHEPDILPPVNYVQPTGIGRDAARRLYQQLLRKGVFQRLTEEYGYGHAALDQKIEMAGARGGDLLITGRVLYYFEGGPLSESRVDEAITVIDVRTKEVLWYAEAREIGEPVEHADYFVLIRESEPAPPASTLLVLNAKKFANMLAGSVPLAP